MLLAYLSYIFALDWIDFHHYNIIIERLTILFEGKRTIPSLFARLSPPKPAIPLHHRGRVLKNSWVREIREVLTRHFTLATAY